MSRLHASPAGAPETSIDSRVDRLGGESSPTNISVVLPVHNEEACLEQELRRIRAGLDASPYSWELIAIDDGRPPGFMGDGRTDG